jgi:FkbM family methyltransferase
MPVTYTLRPVVCPPFGRVFVREGTSDQAVLEQIFQTEEFNISTAPQFAWVRAAYEATLARGDIPLIIDCGANNGLTCLYYAHHLPKARIVGIEPSAENVAIARKNTADLQLVEILEAAVNDTPGRFIIENPDAEAFAFITKEADADAVGGIEAVTITGILERFGASRALIVKVDIEGAEHELFRSHTSWLDHTDLLTVETHDWLFPGKGTSSTLFQAIGGRTFEVIHKGEYISFFFKS